jgi:hypothetical protein
MPLTQVNIGLIDVPQSYGFRNRIINGDMRIDQRNNGASQTVTTAGAYTVDRFFVQPTGASVTTQRVTGSGQYQNALRITGAASVTQCFVQQKIEALNSSDLAGQTVTVTIRASSSTLTSLTCYVERATAGTDNWATFATDKMQSITITSTPTDYTFQATLSASATNGIRFIFATGAFTSGNLDITGVQLEAGTTATPFERVEFGESLRRCQRYYYRKTAGSATEDIAVMQAYSTGSVYGKLLDLPVTMRANATCNISAASHFRPASSNGTAQAAFSGVGAFAASNTSIVQVGGFSGSSGLTAGNASSLSFNTTSGWIDASAEL